MSGAVRVPGERRLAAIAIAMLALSIAAGLLLPLYTDEIGCKLNLAR